MKTYTYVDRYRRLAIEYMWKMIWTNLENPSSRLIYPKFHRNLIGDLLEVWNVFT